MLLKEFIERTGFTPAEDYYTRIIEPEYMSSDLDKDQFCKQWKKNGGIQKAYDCMKEALALSSTDILNLRQYVDKYQDRLAEVNDKLDDERQDLKVLQQTYDSLNEKFLGLIDFLIRQPDAASIRDKVIELVGTKQYLRTKLEKGMELSEEDKALLLEML